MADSSIIQSKFLFETAQYSGIFQGCGHVKYLRSQFDTCQNQILVRVRSKMDICSWIVTCLIMHEHHGYKEPVLLAWFISY